jgi:hypothetical protein
MRQHDARLSRAKRAASASNEPALAPSQPTVLASIVAVRSHFGASGRMQVSPRNQGSTLRELALRGVLGAMLALAGVACGEDGTTAEDSDRSPSSSRADGGGTRDEPSANDAVEGGSEDDELPARDAGRAGSTPARDGATQSPGKADAQAARPDGPSTPGKSDGADGGEEGDPSTPARDGGGEEPATACNPADMKPPPANVPVSSIRRYQGQTVAPAKGPYKPVLETDPGLPEYTIYRPEKLGDVKHPVVVWANGGCSKDGTYFSKYLLEVASHGFVAISVGRPNGTGMGMLGPDGAPQIKALDWILAENERPCSQYYRKLDVTKSAAMGQSCGGLMTLGASKDKRLTTVGIFNSGLFDKDQAIYNGLHTPVGYFIGGDGDIAYPQAESDVMMINKVPLFYGNLDVGHFATWAEDNAGEFGRVGIGWLKWHLMGDSAAEKMFKGKDCELCVSPSKWKISKKMME